MVIAGIGRFGASWRKKGKNVHFLCTIFWERGIQSSKMLIFVYLCSKLAGLFQRRLIQKLFLCYVTKWRGELVYRCWQALWIQFSSLLKKPLSPKSIKRIWLSGKFQFNFIFLELVFPRCHIFWSSTCLYNVMLF